MSSRTQLKEDKTRGRNNERKCASSGSLEDFVMEVNRDEQERLFVVLRER